MRGVISRIRVLGAVVIALSCGDVTECELGQSWCEGNTLLQCGNYSGHPCIVPFCEDPVTEIVSTDCSENGICLDGEHGATCVTTKWAYCEGNTVVRYDLAADPDQTIVTCPEYCVESPNASVYCSPIAELCENNGERICMSTAADQDPDAGDGGDTADAGADGGPSDAPDRIVICNGDKVWVVESECKGGSRCVEVALEEGRQAACE